MDTVLQDLRFALRLLRRHPGTSLILVITLALGIGANTAVFSVVNAVFMRPLPYDDPDRLVLVLASRPEAGLDRQAVSYADFRDWRQQNDVFTDMAAVSLARPLTLTGTDQPEHLLGEFVSAHYFALLGIRPRLGRTFRPEEASRPGSEPVALISHALWQRRFAADPDVVGQTLRLNDFPFTVVGILPPVYRGILWDPIDVWIPITMASTLLQPSYVEQRDNRWHLAVGRLRPGSAMHAARIEMNTIAERLETEHPATNDGWRVALTPLAEFYFANVKQGLVFLLLSSGFVLLIACANVAGLFLTQVASRRREVAVRTALGAGRGRLARLFFVQSLVISLLGGAMGLALTFSLTRFLVSLSDIRPASFVEVYVDQRILFLTLALALLTTLFGVAPALTIRRSGLQEALKEGSHGSTGGKANRRLRSLLVVSEVAVALTLLVGAGLMIQSFQRLRDGDPGFPTEGLLTLRLDLQSSRYGDAEMVQRFTRRVSEEVQALPGVESVSLLGPSLPPFADLEADITPEERLQDPGEHTSTRVHRHYVLPGHFHALGIPVHRGRGFTQQDSEETPVVAVVSAATAELFTGDALGHRFSCGECFIATRRSPGDREPWVTVVGVAGNVKNRGLTVNAERDRDIYLSILQLPISNLNLIVRTRVAPSGLLPALKRAVHRLDPDLPLYDVQSMRESFSLKAADSRLSAVLMGSFALIAATLAVMGIYGVVSAAVGQRQHEFGIRLALGARRGQVLGLVLRSGLLLLAAGVGLGLLGFLALSRMITQLLYGIAPADPLTLGFSLLLLGTVALVATLVCARRVTNLDPAKVLRDE